MFHAVPSSKTLYSARFDAFRSIFPAGTVSGAPKIKAVELVSGLEGERRGVYAGAVGRFDFADDEMDTCIAIRTMTIKDGVAYLQAGGGIVFDSVEEDEYVETINKLSANMKTIDTAEGTFYFHVIFIHLKPNVHRVLLQPPTTIWGTEGLKPNDGREFV